MSTPPLNVDEAARLQALAELDMSDAEPDVALTHIVELAARLLGAPTAFVSFVDRDRQIFNAKVGLDLCETARDIAFCNRTIAQDTLLVVRDATRDPRFCDNPLVSGPPFIRFYAGAPLRTRAGHAIGTLCLLGPEPRDAFTDQDRQILADLARLVIDRLELRRAEAGRRATQTRFEHIADTSPDAIVCTDAQGLVSFWSAGAEHMFGHTGAEVLGRSIARLIPDRMAGGSEGLLRRLAQGSAEHLTGRTVELTAEHRDGREFPVELSLSTWRENGVPTHGAIMRDVSQRWAIEERLFRLAHLDPLTELPNRLVLRGRIEAALAQAEPAAVLMFDLDGFKEVNDAHGHAVGDAVLKVTAARLRACAVPSGPPPGSGATSSPSCCPASATRSWRSRRPRRPCAPWPSPTASTGWSCISGPAPASRSARRTRPRGASSWPARTPPSTTPRPAGEDSTACSPPSCARRSSARGPAAKGCAARSCGTSSSSTTSRRCASPTARSWAPRR
jgi:PAS domain S-box-containing protein